MIFIVSGPGGVGKGTVVRGVLDLVPGLRLSRSWTTRPRRQGEAEDAYHFTDRDRFLTAAGQGRFLEWTEFAGTGHLYGTPRPDPGAAGDLLLEIELDGAQQVKALDPTSVLVLLEAPSAEEQAQRLRGRGDPEEAVRRRLEVGEGELEVGRRLADHVVVNRQPGQAAAEVAAIIALHRRERPPSQAAGS